MKVLNTGETYLDTPPFGTDWQHCTLCKASKYESRNAGGVLPHGESQPTVQPMLHPSYSQAIRGVLRRLHLAKLTGMCLTWPVCWT